MSNQDRKTETAHADCLQRPGSAHRCEKCDTDHPEDVGCHSDREPEGPQIKCPHCGYGLLWSEDRGAHCDGCEDFNPETDLPNEKVSV